MGQGTIPGKSFVPPAGLSQVWLDFDHTLTRQDVLDELIARYAVDESWREIEHRWERGEIGSRECLGGQLDLVRIAPAQLKALLDGIVLDPGALRLFKVLESERVPVVVLSDCIDQFIQRILGRHGLGRVPVRANAAAIRADRVELLCPHANPRCTSAAAHCKCASIDALGRPDRRSLYVGDGRSDLCAARKADLVFAKGVLADCLDKESRRYVRYATLNGVADLLEAAWVAPSLSAATQRGGRERAG